MRRLKIDLARCRYRALIGTGGVGSGSFFALEGDHTLGREESRAGRFLDRQDYCKLHIVTHYVQVLLGPGFHVIPASKVGDDDIGRRLLIEMQEIGLDTRYIVVSPGDATLYSFCFIYPDGSGGNLTTSNAATAKVDPAFIAALEPEFARWSRRGMALALPEVPLPARLRLLELGAQYGFFRVASLTAQEARSELALAVARQCDLLALNLEEAAALVALDSPSVDPTEAIQAALTHLRQAGSAAHLSVTGGKLGSWCWDGMELHHVPAVPAQVVNTAGAGDAHLAGVIVGLVVGLSLPVAQQLGSLIASRKVSCPHTLDKSLDRAALASLARRAPLELDALVWPLLDEDG